jgi:hypothetical protein
MTDNKATTEPEPQPTDEQDVEGHNMWIGPSIATDMARSRSKDLERAAKERNRAKEAKKG